MSVAPKRVSLDTTADLLAIPEAERFDEIIGGELVRKAMPSGPHGLGQSEPFGDVELDIGALFGDEAG